MRAAMGPLQQLGPARKGIAGATMSYAVKEIFLTLQGEGAQAGRAAVFCRFGGCNLWSGRESDRPTANCSFCDTDFVHAVRRVVSIASGERAEHEVRSGDRQVGPLIVRMQSVRSDPV